MILINKLVIVTFLLISFVAGQYRGNYCKLKDNSIGTCKLIGECPEAIASIQKGVYPQKCGFEGTTQLVVCCSDTQTKPVTTSKPTELPKPTSTSAVYSKSRRPEVISNQRPQGTVGREALLTEQLKSVTTPKQTKLPNHTDSTSALYSKSRTPGVISNQKCRDYSQYAWTVMVNPTFFANAPAIKKSECSFTKQELVVGGVAATRKEFPHMVQLGYDAIDGVKWTCGGSLISDQYVLTAAHCLNPQSIDDVKYARMGIIDLNSNEHLQQVDIEKTIPHPDHEEPSHYHDIGLVKLSKPVTLNTWVRPACIHTSRSSPWSKVIACGWGKTEFTGTVSNILQRVILELYNQPRCNRTYKQQYGTGKLKEGIKDETMICAGHSTDLKDTCQGDSGGPLQVYRNEDEEISCMYDVIGVTSFGIGCGLAVNIPGVYTRVAYYTKWIEDIVWPPLF